MPRVKKTSVKTKKVTKKIEKVALKAEKKTTGKIKWGESYTSLLLGIVVVVIAFLLVFSIVRNHNYKNTISTNIEDIEGTKAAKTYEVKAGEDLWKISEKIYGSGYNWVDLAKTNKIANPDVVKQGTKLTVPEVKVIKVADKNTQEAKSDAQAITGDKYTVKKGDYLWDIAVRAYGDGYKWVEIAKANKLTNPDLIFSDTVLILPR